MTIKRREFERHRFRLPVTARWEGREERTASRVLGLGGMFLLLSDPPPPGTVLALTLTLVSLQGRKEVTVDAEVLYAEAEGVGVKFMNTSAEVRAGLRAFFLLQDLHCYNTDGPGKP